MANPLPTQQPSSPAAQQPSSASTGIQTGASATLRIGDTLALETRITTGGLVAVAAIVSAALLGSAVIVRAARHDGEVG